MSAVAENIQAEMPSMPDGPLVFTDSAAAKVADLNKNASFYEAFFYAYQ